MQVIWQAALRPIKAASLALEKSMNIRGLEALHALVQGGGIAAAAKQMHRTQPQVSRILSQLEEDVGFPLLRKEGRRLILTPDGSEFYRRMMGLLEHKDALQVFSENIRMKRAHRLHIVVANHMVEAFLLDAVIRAHAQRPELSVSINTRMPLMPQSTLGGEAFDMALAQLPIDHPALDAVKLLTLDMVAIAPQGHRFAEQETVRVEDFEGEAYVSLPPRSVLRGRSDQVLDTLRNRPYYQFEASFASMTCHLVAGGCGVAVADPLAALAHRHRGLVIRRFQPGIALNYGLAFPINQERSETSRFFEGVIRRVLEEKVAILQDVLNGRA